MCGRVLLPFLIVLSASTDPKVHDSRLRLELFASAPDIVTPIGLAIDSHDRIFVIESHTHMPPRDYAGPKSDRIKVFTDTDSDEKSDSIKIFAEGFHDAMNLAFAPDDSLYIVSGKSVDLLHDKDEDGVAESRRRILELKSSNNYAHSALLAITFGPDGWVYVSRGNNGSAAYTIVGSDGSKVTGFGDGGNIVRCKPDGSKLREYATGFWNPFDIKFDAHGRLLCVDNDPDARGPNRLLHIVQHGDYGYRSIYGGAGNHPFQGWDGDLPGTLPMMDGIGEAPSGLLDARATSLPPELANSLLVTVWGENTISRHIPRPRGISLAATNSVLVSGAKNFRPVALAANSKGVIYITDWVLVDYPNHGHGRIWKLTGPGKPTPVEGADGSFAVSNPILAASSTDPFVRHAAVIELSKETYRNAVFDLAGSKDARARLSALLALRRGPVDNPEAYLGKFLQDSSSEVRRAAMIWAAEQSLTNLLPEVHATIERADLMPIEFETYLAAVELLQPEFVHAFRSRTSDKANQLPRPLPNGFVDSLVARKELPAQVRALAVTHIENSAVQIELISALLTETNLLLQTEALRALAVTPGTKAAKHLKEFAETKDHPASLRAEALNGLSWHGEADLTWLLTFLNEPLPVTLEAAGLLRSANIPKSDAEILKQRMDREKNPILKEALLAAVAPEKLARPSTVDSWIKTLSTGGDPSRGARVFFSARTACSQCHTIRNRGGKLGPDLSAFASSVSREQIVRSILHPSEQFPPQYQAWFIRSKDGDITQGLQLDHASNGLEILTTSGKFEFIPSEKIDSYGPLPRSLMPDGLEQTMTVSELRDLVAFLESCR
jgi:putative membrane-bound dehydrogenase-like protein